MILNRKNQDAVGKRKKYKNPLIMESPDLQTMRQRYSSSFITFFFWVIWIYLVHPLNSLIAWMLGGQFFYKNMILLDGWTGLMEKLPSYAVVLLIIAVVFFGWAFYNNARFYNRERRRTVMHVTDKTLSDFFNISESDVRTCKNSERLVIDFDDSGQIVSLESTNPYPEIKYADNDYLKVKIPYLPLDINRAAN
jgi:poly-beta-1,6-N-acetyl-D-glucosamine biosynthesis protein PgaD